MALPAGRLDIRARDSGLRARRRLNIVETVAVPAMRGFDESKRRDLGMEGVPICLELIGVASAAGSGGLRLPGGGANAGDLMRGVAIRADRRPVVSLFHRFPVNSGQVCLFGTSVASAARGRNVGARSAAFGIFIR